MDWFIRATNSFKSAMQLLRTSLDFVCVNIFVLQSTLLVQEGKKERQAPNPSTAFKCAHACMLVSFISSQAELSFMCRA